MGISLSSIVNPSKVCVWDVPFRASDVFDVIRYAVLISIPIILDPCRIRFTRVNNPVEVGILHAVVKWVPVRVVISGVRGKGGAAIAAVDLNAIGDAVIVRVHCSWICEEDKCLS